MKILLTGGAGFIGSHIGAELVQQGMQVRVLDNLSSGKKENLAGLDIKLTEGAIVDFDTVFEAMAGCELVFHQAAFVTVPGSIENPTLNHAVNVTGTANVFEAARQHGVKRVVYASSAAVYGGNPQLPCTVGAPLEPISPYALAKGINEQYAEIYTQLYGLESVGLRYFNVYGPRQDPSSPYSGFLSICCDRLAQNQPITIFGDGEQTRDFVYVADVVQANLNASRAEFNPKQTVFNVASGESKSLNEVIQVFETLMGQKITADYQPARAGDIRYSAADVQGAEKGLGFKAKVNLEEGLGKTFDWFRNPG